MKRRYVADSAEGWTTTFLVEGLDVSDCDELARVEAERIARQVWPGPTRGTVEVWDVEADTRVVAFAL